MHLQNNNEMMETLNIVLEVDEEELADKTSMKRSMLIWITAADTLLAMIAMRLSLPRRMQKYRFENCTRGSHGRHCSERSPSVRPN